MTNTLNIQYMSLNYIDLTNGPEALITWFSPEYLHEQFESTAIGIGSPQNVSATPYPVFPSVADAVAYYNPTICNDIINLVNTDIGTAYYTAYTIAAIDPSVNAALNAVISSIPTTVSALTNDSGFITAAALMGYVTSGALSTALASYATSASVTSGLAGKQSTIATGSTSQYLRGDGTLATFPSIPSAQVNADWSASSGVTQVLNKPKSYNGTTLRTAPVEYTNSGSFSSGSVVFYLTSDGTSTGTALFPTAIDTVNITINGTSGNLYTASYALTNSNKTLTITGTQISSIIGLLTLASAANGVNVNVWVKGY